MRVKHARFSNFHALFSKIAIRLRQGLRPTGAGTKTRIMFATEATERTEDCFRHGLTPFVSTSSPMSRSPLCSKQRLCSKRVFAPAGLLCPRAEKSAFVETKHGYDTVFKR